jgi:hypothetical protein
MRVRVMKRWTLGTPTFGNAVAAVVIIIALAIANIWVAVLPVRLFLFTSEAAAIAPATLAFDDVSRRRAESRERLSPRDL